LVPRRSGVTSWHFASMAAGLCSNRPHDLAVDPPQERQERIVLGHLGLKLLAVQAKESKYAKRRPRCAPICVK
jgi:hypothetical protein